MRCASELLLECVRDHILHVLQLLLQVLQLVIIPIDGLLVGNKLSLKALLLHLSLFQLLSQLTSQDLKLLAVMNVLLQLI